MNIALLQTKLRELGLYSGEVDGKWGPLSQAGFDKLVAGYLSLPKQASAAATQIQQNAWVWDQSEGALYRNGRKVAAGYSGKGAGRNNPAMENVVATGPIPAGKWFIGKPRTSPKTGPVVMDLSPVGHKAHGRSAFQIHGDNATGTASSGCIILPRAIREEIVASGVTDLLVVA